MAEYKHGSMDVTDHTATFDGFVKFVTWAVIMLLAIMVLMAIYAR